MRKVSLTAGIMFCLADSALGQNGTSTQSGYWGLIAAFGSVVVGLILANAYVVSLFHSKRSGDTGVLARWNEKWEFSARALGGFSWWQLAMWSLLSLFFELLMIRWISSEIRIFAYFKNFVLVACFLGFGVGFYLCRRAISVTLLIAPLLYFVLLIQLPWEGLRLLIVALPTLLGATSEVQIWAVGSTGLTSQGIRDLFLASLITVPMFGLLATTFIPVGQIVGWLLETAPKGIAAYSVNVIASLAGIVLYTSLCFANQPPAVWFSVAGLLAVTLFWRLPRIRWTCAVTFLACVGLLMIPNERGRVFWSPYQKLSLTPLRVGND